MSCVKYALIFLLLTGCGMNASFTMKCKGDCEATIDRQIEELDPSVITGVKK
jgi:hypothetical protein